MILSRVLFRSAEWSVTEWIKQVRSELGCWRAVYWKLWGHCHWQLCSICHTYYPLSQTEWCSYHPDSPQFFIMEQHRTMSFPIGKCQKISFICYKRSFFGQYTISISHCSTQILSLILNLRVCFGHFLGPSPYTTLLRVKS